MRLINEKDLYALYNSQSIMIAQIECDMDIYQKSNIYTMVYSS